MCIVRLYLYIGRVSRCICRHAYTNDDDHRHNNHNHHKNDNHDYDDKNDKQRSFYRPRIEKALGPLLTDVCLVMRDSCIHVSLGALLTLHQPTFGGILCIVTVQTIRYLPNEFPYCTGRDKLVSVTRDMP